MTNLRWLLAAVLVSATWPAEARGQVTQRVSLYPDGTEAPVVHLQSAISADGRFVAFITITDAKLFVRDRLLGTTEPIHPESTFWSDDHVALSGDGRYLAFGSDSALVPGDTNFDMDVFVRDLVLDVTVRASVTSGGLQVQGMSGWPTISDDGRCVAFLSESTDLVPFDTNGRWDVFVRDLQAGTTERVSVDSSEIEADENSSVSPPAISADGRFVTFLSGATTYVFGVNGGLFLRDRVAGTTECVSLDSNGVSLVPDYRFGMSADGGAIAFHDPITDQTYVRDRQSATTELIGVSSSGRPANAECNRPRISGDGRFVSFQSAADNLVPGEIGAWQDVYLRDRLLQTTTRVSTSSAGVPGNSHSGESRLGSDGRYVLFQSLATNLVPETAEQYLGLYVHDRLGGPAFTSLCDPGASGVVGCPCANPPSGAGRGCDNSAATGGAILAASGGTYLSSDSLVFTTSGEKPTATSILLQGTTSLASGTPYGQGVRCVGGSLKRLFTKSAVGGSITAPNFGAGDPTVSSRSAAKGNPIFAGESRWYLVFYRDPIVLGGCPATSTFNATQTGRVDWSL